MGIFEDPQKARREQHERERQARLKREADAKAKAAAKAKAEADEKAKAAAKARAKAKAAEHSDPKSETQKPKIQKPGQFSLLYGSISPLYGQGSSPIAKVTQPKPEHVVPDDREARIWSGEKKKPEPERQPFEPRDMDAVKARVLRRIELREQQKEQQGQANVAPDTVSLSAALMNPLMGATLVSGAQVLGQSEPIQVASVRGQGQGAIAQTPQQQFQHRLKDGAIHRLEQNKARLTQVQGTYQNTQTSNGQWETLRTLAKRDQQLKRLQDQTNQELMTLIAKKEFSNTPLGRLANQTPLGKMLDLPKSDPIQNSFLLNVLGVSPQDVDPKYREQFTGLRSRLELLYGVRQEMRAVHPALAVVDTYVISVMANTEWNNSVIYRDMGKGFDGMRSDMSKLR
jgi:hypothetical protein